MLTLRSIIKVHEAERPYGGVKRHYFAGAPYALRNVSSSSADGSEGEDEPAQDTEAKGQPES